MADWVPMRSTLVLESPKVGTMARYLAKQPEFREWLLDGARNESNGTVENVRHTALRYVTVSALLRVWHAATMHTTDGSFRHATIDDLDDAAGIPGFGRAMEYVGWATQSTDRVTLPNFLRHNVPETIRPKQAKSNAQRQREFRARQKAASAKADSAGVTDQTKSNACNATEQNRTEQNRTLSPYGREGVLGGEFLDTDLQVPIPADLDKATFHAAWREWLDYRAERRLKTTAVTLEKQLRLLATLGEAGAVEAIEQSIRCGWKGLFEPGGNGRTKKTPLMRKFSEIAKERGIE